MCRDYTTKIAKGASLSGNSREYSSIGGGDAGTPSAVIYATNKNLTTLLSFLKHLPFAARHGKIRSGATH